MEPCRPPDPNTRKPGWVPPSGACDTHCHVFGPSSRYGYTEGSAYIPPDAVLQDLQRLHGILGLDRAVIVQSSVQGTDNSNVLDSIASGQGRYRGVAIVDGGFSRVDLEELHEGGIRGVRFSHKQPIGGPPDMSLIERTVDLMAPLGWHLVFHSSVPDVIAHAAVLEAMPVPVVIDHMAQADMSAGVEDASFQTLLALIRDGGLWVKISCAERLSAAGPPYDDVVPIARALIDNAPDRILWGSDWPHPNLKPAKKMPNDGDMIDLLALYAPDEEMRKRILVDNPAQLYDFGD